MPIIIRDINRIIGDSGVATDAYRDIVDVTNGDDVLLMTRRYCKWWQ